MTYPTLKLRRTEETDLDFVLSLEHDDENRRYVVAWPRAKHQETLRDPNMAHLVVENENERLGYLILAGLADPNRSIELRRIVIAHKGQGYGTTTLRMVKDLAFKTYHAHRLWLDVKEFNERALSVYKREGFTVEGCLRECLKTEGGYDSLVIMSILEQELPTSTLI